MKAEIICIGTELLLGQIVNTNARFFAKELHELGIDSYYQSTVGDNEKRIHEALKIAFSRSDIVITSGGLGPTADDITHESISSYFNKKLVLDKNILNEIKNKFSSVGYKKMPDMNKKQAYKPRDAKWIPNKTGTAPGILLKLPNSKYILTFPGVPGELYSMWNAIAKPFLKKISGNHHIFSKTLKFTGIGESALAEKIESMFNLKDPTVAPYASLGEVLIRVTSKSKNLNDAKANVNETCKKILAKTGDYYFGLDDETLESIVVKILTSKKLKIAIAESCTGGFLSKRLTDIPGSSAFIDLNLVTYSNDAKNKLLKVPNEKLKKYGAVSPEVAISMASGIKNLAKSDIGFSITGIAGPSGGSKEKPIGLVYFALAYKGKVKVENKIFSSRYSRLEIRWLATQFALNWLRRLEHVL